MNNNSNEVYRITKKNAVGENVYSALENSLPFTACEIRNLEII
jgi:hypothetical protein